MPLPTMRASQIPESKPKDVDFQRIPFQYETEYPNLNLSWGRLLSCIVLRFESTIWNVSLCILTLLAIVILSMDYVSEQTVFDIPVSALLDLAFNVLYGIDMVMGMLYDYYLYHHEQQFHQFAKKHWLLYLVESLTYLHYVTKFLPKTTFDIDYIVTMVCYYVRLRRIGVYIMNLDTHYLESGVITSCLKYWYIFLLIRVIFANTFIWFGLISEINYKLLPSTLNKSRAIKFVHGFYILDKRFFPIGTDCPPHSDLDRVATMIVTISGSLLVIGFTIAALALIISNSMRFAYMFRDRFRLIINNIQSTNVPIELIGKVLAFYKTYWHKQKAISVTRLLPSYPHTLVNTLTTDIYFEALQKSQILRDLSYQFLTELANHMKTINYVPGDVIIKRKHKKYAVVFITYGDVHVVTAEDDETPILRFTRGSIINPCGACMDVACSKNYVSVRAATFCTAHVLKSADLWRVAVKHGHLPGQTYIIHSAMDEHLNKVVHHYAQRPHSLVKNKSSVLQLKRNLIELKEARDENGKLLIARTDYFLQIADCYIMRHQPDATALTEESDAICLRSTFPCILQPTSDLQLIWRFFVTVITLAVLFVHPYYLIFRMHMLSELPNNFVIFNFMVTVVYILDIIVYLSTGTNIEEGMPISLLQTSSRQMRNAWFVMDVLAAVPISDLIGYGQLSGLNKLCKLPHVFHTLKILEEMMVLHSNVLQFFTFCLLLLVFIWLVAALNQGFLCFNFNFCAISSFLDTNVWEHNRTAKTDSEIQDILTYSMFWATSLTTMTSHMTSEVSNDHFPTQIQVMCILEVGVILHIVVEAVYAATIVVTGQLRNKYDDCIDAAQLFLQKNEVDPELQHRFINYLQLCWYSDKAYGLTHEKSSILFDLPYKVHQDISAMQRNKYLLCIPFMKELPEKEHKSICAAAQIFYISPNEILLNTGDISNEIYVIKRGFCELIKIIYFIKDVISRKGSQAVSSVASLDVESYTLEKLPALGSPDSDDTSGQTYMKVLDPDTKKVVKIISTNAYFGDIECLMRLPAYYTVRAVTHVEVFSVSRKHLLKAIATKKISDAILYMRDLPEFQKLLNNRREQFLKYERPPQPGNKMIFRLPRKHETDEDFLKPFQNLGIFSMFKYIFPRFTIRPDGQYLRRHERFHVFCAMWSALITPTFYLFDLQYDYIDFITWLIDITCYFDVLQRMVVGYFNEKGILVYHPVSTFIHYFRGAFIVDLLACLPLEFLEDLDVYLNYRTETYSIIPRAKELLLFNRVLQLYRLPPALDFLDNYIKRRDIILCIKYVPFFLALIMTISTFIRINSVTKYKFHKGGWKIMPKSSKFTSWILYNSTNVGYSITQTPFNYWLATYYWATSQLSTTGFRIFLPNTKLLLLIFIVGMFIARITTLYISVRMLSARSNVNRALAEYNDNIKDMTIFMKREKIPKHLRREVLSYYKYTWEKTGGTDYRSLFKLCGQVTLRTDAILHIYGDTFQKSPILHKCDTSLLRLLARAMHSVYFRRDTTVIRRDDVNSDLYFVDYGTIQARSRKDNDIIDVFLPRGSMFGNLNNVVREVSTRSFVVESNVHLLKIESWLFYNILKDFPVISERLIEYRPNNENFVVSNDADGYRKDQLQKSRSTLFFGNKGCITYFYSHSWFMIIYGTTICLFCVFLDIYNAGFHDNRHYIIITLYTLDLAFIPNIIANILFPFITKKEIESHNVVTKARKKYLWGVFIYDFLSVLPLELFSLCFQKPYKVFAFFRLNRCLRMVTVLNYLQFTNTMASDLKTPAIISLVVIFLLFIHATTCFWQFLGDYHDSIKPKSSWRWKKNNATGLYSSVCFDNQYICCMYFIIITTMRAGGGHDMLPRQHIEVIFVCVLMICSLMMYMICVGELSRIIHYHSYRIFKFYEMYFELQEFLKNNHVSRRLVEQTKKYTLYLWRESRGLQFPHFVETAPQCLRLDIMAAAYIKHLEEIPIFKHCEPAFLRQLVGHLKPFYYDGDMYVVREGELTNSMYIVHKGRVAEVADEIGESTKLMHRGEYFGIVQGLYRNVPFPYSYKAQIKSQVLTLSLDAWEYLLMHYPDKRNIIYRNVQDPRSYNEFKSEKVKDLRMFPPRSCPRLVTSDLPKSSAGKTTTSESDDIARSTEQLLQELKEKVRSTLRDLNYDEDLYASAPKTEIKPSNEKEDTTLRKSPTELIEAEFGSQFPFLKKESLTSPSQTRPKKHLTLLSPKKDSQNMPQKKEQTIDNDLSIQPPSSSKRNYENLSIGKKVQKYERSKLLKSLSPEIKKKYKKYTRSSSTIAKGGKKSLTKANIPKKDSPQLSTTPALDDKAGSSATVKKEAIITNPKSSPLISTSDPVSLKDRIAEPKPYLSESQPKKEVSSSLIKEAKDPAFQENLPKDGTTQSTISSAAATISDGLVAGTMAHKTATRSETMDMEMAKLKVDSKSFERVLSGTILEKQKKEHNILQHSSSPPIKDTKASETKENLSRRDMPQSDPTPAAPAIASGLAASKGAAATTQSGTIPEKEKKEHNILMHTLLPPIKDAKALETKENIFKPDIPQPDLKPAAAAIESGLAAAPTGAATHSRTIPEKEKKEHNTLMHTLSPPIKDTKASETKENITKRDIPQPDLKPVAAAIESVLAAASISAATQSGTIPEKEKKEHNILMHTLSPPIKDTKASETKENISRRDIPQPNPTPAAPEIASGLAAASTGAAVTTQSGTIPEKEKKEHNTLMHTLSPLIKDTKASKTKENISKQDIPQPDLKPVAAAIESVLAAASIGAAIESGTIPEKEIKEHNILMHTLSPPIKDTKASETKENISRRDKPQLNPTPAAPAIASGLAAASTGAAVTTQSGTIPEKEKKERNILMNTLSPPIKEAKPLETKENITKQDIPQPDLKQAAAAIESGLAAVSTGAAIGKAKSPSNSVVIPTKNEKSQYDVPSHIIEEHGFQQSLDRAEGTSTKPRFHSRPKSTIIGIDTEAKRKEFESIYDQDESAALVLDLIEKSSPSLLRNARKIRPSLEEIELARINYSEEDIDTSAKASKDSIKFDDKPGKDQIKLQQEKSAITPKRTQVTDKSGTGKSSSKAVVSQEKLKREDENN